MGSVAAEPNWLDLLGKLLSVALGLIAALTFVVSRFGLRRVLGRIYLRQIRKAVSDRFNVTPVALARGLTARLEGRNWQLADEYRAVGETLRLDQPVAWVPEGDLVAISEAYERSSAEISRSFLVRLGGGADVIEGETTMSDGVARKLRIDADFHRSSAGTIAPHAGLETLFRRDLGCRMLLWPPRGLGSHYREIRCSLTGEHFGVSSEPFRVLASAIPDGKWPGVCPDIARRLNREVHRLASAPELAGDFNGHQLRLREWRAEDADTSHGSRIHLLGDSSNYASFLATSGGLDLIKDDPEWHETLSELCLDRHLDRGDDGPAPVANVVVIHLAIVTSDRRLVLTRRTTRSRWYGGLLNTAVNGSVELGPRVGLVHGDYDPDGFVDIAETAVREAHEELGSHLSLRNDDLVTHGLGLIRTTNEVSPFAIFEARTSLTLDELAEGHFVGTSRHEGAFELGGELVGLPLDHDTVRKVCRWLSIHRDGVTAGGVATSLLVAGSFLGGDEIVDAWGHGPELPSAEVRAVSL